MTPCVTEFVVTQNPSVGAKPNSFIIGRNPVDKGNWWRIRLEWKVILTEETESLCDPIVLTDCAFCCFLPVTESDKISVFLKMGDSIGV